MPLELGLKGQIALFIGTWIVVLILKKLNNRLFRRLKERKEGLHLLFFEHVISVLIVVAGVVLSFSAFGGLGAIWKTILGGTAIVSAIVAFAAQDVIKDVLAGLMISLYKPFEIGNRVELEDGTVGVIADITMRHVVLNTLDTQRVIIPNSRLNTMRIRNYSYHSDMRSAQFAFHIAYGSDVEKAMEVVADTVRESPYTVAGRETDTGMEYGPVYFMSYEQSSLKLVTTVYYNSLTASEKVISDVNLRVYEALRANGIRIPFNTVQVVEEKADK